MQVAITCRHGSISQDMRDYITRKSEKVVRYLGEVSEIDVTIDFEGGRANVEMLVEIEGYDVVMPPAVALFPCFGCEKYQYLIILLLSQCRFLFFHFMTNAFLLRMKLFLICFQKCQQAGRPGCQANKKQKEKPGTKPFPVN